MPARDYYYCHSYYCHYYDSSYISLSSLLHALPRPRVNREETLSGAASLRPSVRLSVCPPTLFIDIVSLLGFVLACPPPRKLKGWKASARTRTPASPTLFRPSPRFNKKNRPCGALKCIDAFFTCGAIVSVSFFDRRHSRLRPQSGPHSITKPC